MNLENSLLLTWDILLRISLTRSSRTRLVEQSYLTGISNFDLEQKRTLMIDGKERGIVP